MVNPRAAEAGRQRRRTCVGCRKTAHPSQLVRIARAPDGRLAIGPGSGRGAWLCARPNLTSCFEQAVGRGALGRALQCEPTKVELEEVREKLMETDAATKRAERAQELVSERMPAGRVSRPAVSERE